MQPRYARFDQGLDPYWQRQIAGSGRLDLTIDGLRLLNESETSADAYTNAQIDDYQHLSRQDFPWRPPLTLTVRARFSHPGAHEHNASAPFLNGTAGFGFWNDPFLMTGLRTPALPRAIWFFYASPPSNMKLDLHTQGWGWKAATIDAARLPFLALSPTAPLAVPLMHVPFLYQTLWPVAQQVMNVNERMITAPMTWWHIYHLAWGERVARFSVDGRPLLVCNTPPRGPLGLVIWIDNQYMQVTPQGRIRHGLIGKGKEEWMEIDWLAVEQTYARERSS
jgi:hypothetical protein